jgi:uracil permease
MDRRKGEGMTNRISSPDYNFTIKDSLIGAQMLFVAFGALVLVPLLTGLDANVALFTAGAGTLLFQIITRGRVPIFLASSFAFIAPIIYGVKTWGIPGTMCGLVAAGLLYVVLSICIKFFGSGFLHRILPPVVVGPVIMVIGLVLAPVAVNMAMGKAGGNQVIAQSAAMSVSLITLVATILVSLLSRGCCA